MLGQFLEISIHADEVLPTLQLFERMGFTQIRTNDSWTHAYGVVTDGRCFIGVHEYEFPSPSLTFVAPQLRDRVEPLEQAGAEFEFLKLADTQFHELGFLAPDEQMVCLIEARTFSPPDTNTIGESLLGYFLELRLPVEDEEHALESWLRYGLIERDTDEALPESAAACCTGLNLGFSEATRIKRPTLFFQCENLAALQEALEQRDVDFKTGSKGQLDIKLPGRIQLSVVAERSD
ncbi:MAG: hypothetical protein R3217_05930 [Gammaproteobacteria bacterium]|nr:hypothetical protein [Gammaproteobacteria bacterium]